MKRITISDIIDSMEAYSRVVEVLRYVDHWVLYDSTLEDDAERKSLSLVRETERNTLAHIRGDLNAYRQDEPVLYKLAMAIRREALPFQPNTKPVISYERATW